MTMRWIWKGLEWAVTMVGLWITVDAVIGGLSGTYSAYDGLPVVSVWWIIPALLGLALFLGGLCLIFRPRDKDRGRKTG